MHAKPEKDKSLSKEKNQTKQIVPGKKAPKSDIKNKSSNERMRVVN